MTEFCDYPYCACEGPRPTLKCGLPWRGPAEKAIAAKLAASPMLAAQQSDLGRAMDKVAAAGPHEAVELTEAELKAYSEHKLMCVGIRPGILPGAASEPPQYVHLVGYGQDHPGLEALCEARAARRKRWLFEGAQAAFLGVLLAVEVFLVCAVVFMIVWYLDGQAIEQAQRAAIQ